MSSLPVQHYRSAGLPPEMAFEAWRGLMAPIYGITPPKPEAPPPGGAVTAYLVGDLIANRTRFTAQHVTRDRRRVDGTPDHLTIQLWRHGRFEGEVAGRAARLQAGDVALADRRRTLAGHIAPADTLGLAIPRNRLHGMALDGHGLHLDPARNRLLEARLVSFYGSLAGQPASAGPAIAAEMLAFLRRLFDPAKARDVLEGPELDSGLATLALREVRARLAEPGLTPQALAEAVGVSRATLYRAFAQTGGIMRVIQEERLDAARDALSDPFERRSLTKLAEAHGFSSLSLFSRSFRARFDHSPRAWRAERISRATKTGPQSVGPLQRWWSELGR